MKLTHVRNATMIVEVAGKRVLVDPMLGAKHSSMPAPTDAGTHERNPLVDLTLPLAELVHVDMVVVTHIHPDHWDAAAASLLGRDIPVLTQHEADAAQITEAGFSDVRVLENSRLVDDIRFTRTEGQHGSDAFLAAVPDFGQVMGVVIDAPGESTVYFAGDTLWGDPVRTALADHAPDVIVLNTGEATWAGGEVIIMGKEDISRVHKHAPKAQIVAVHMEALNHCITRRKDVRALAVQQGIADRVHIPEDGEHLVFT